MKHYDRNGVEIRIEENNVVLIHNNTWLDSSTNRKRVDRHFRGQLGVVVRWGCVAVDAGKTVSPFFGLSYYNPTDLEVIGTL